MMKELALPVVIASVIVSLSAFAQTDQDPISDSNIIHPLLDTDSAFKPFLGTWIDPAPYLFLSISPEWTFWEPGINSKQAPILNFTGQGFNGLRIAGGVGIDGEPLTVFSYSRPFNRSSVDQTEVIDMNGRDGFESLQVAARIGAAATTFLPKSPITRFIGSTSVSFTKETFVGSAKANTDAKLLKFGAILEPNGQGGYYINNVAQAIASINSQENYRFRTEFKDLEATVDLIPLLDHANSAKNDVEIRIGGYWLDWARPAEIGNGVTFTALGRSYPVVHQAKYHTKGLVVRIGDKSPGEGVDFSFAARIGINDDIETAFPGLLESSNPRFYGFQAKIGYNCEIYSGPHSQVFLSPSASIDFRNFMENTKDSNGNTLVSEKILDGEKIYKLYVRLWTKF